MPGDRSDDDRPGVGRSGNLIVGLGRDTIRGWGMATARWRPDPEFLVIGAKRGGSTSFYYDLARHPQIAPLFPRPDHLPKAELTKGVHYFDVNYLRGERWYRSHLPSRLARQRLAARTGGGAVITGEASPYYLFHPAAAERAAALVPGTRIIAVLRDPVARTYSHWKERRRQGREPLDFADALAAEDERLGDAERHVGATADAYSYAHEQQSYARQSEYAPALRRWYEHFPRERILVLASEDYYADPVSTLAAAHRFLGLPPAQGSSGEVRNAAEGDPLDPALERDLRARFASSNSELETLTGRSFPWPTAT